ncbi:sensor histidine kinase [Leisingera sp. ANG-S5]|uniref:sensor histidine kinase n=1 Tax=Leisingera sp. ANG-S5 TaxID=1577901 RepID=UPI00057DA242|nr:ATP-binding protein [Leisingera sp. ANG-S5]KIC31321.1 C4-dicarboxylate ABC transporter [Leisingera sp. ANG-S5]
MRLIPFLISLVVTIAVAVGVFRVSSVYFQSEEVSQAEGPLSLYQSSVVAELERFSHLTHVLARDASVIGAAGGDDTGTLNLRLEDFAAKAGLDAIYLMDTNGVAIAASNFRQTGSFVGQNYAFRPYFQQALQGGQGRFYAIGTTTGLPGYFIADAVRGPDGTLAGVIAIKIGFQPLEQSWSGSGEQVLMANEDGVVLLASDPGWRYRVLAPLSEGQRQRIKAARQFPGQALEPLDWQAGEGPRAVISGREQIHLTAPVPPHGWTLHYFASGDRAVARSWLVTSLVGFAAGLALILFQVQRARRISAALARSEQEEAQLRRANELLAGEIEDRRTAERRLKRTQDELERASRLAALGRLAASVTHELGQPIAAMRNHLVAAEIAPGNSAALPARIGALVDRMEGITRQLKFFATPDAESQTAVDLNAAMRASAALVAPNLEEAGAELRLDLCPGPVSVQGSRLRIEQVMTNLLRNAIDASDDSAAPLIVARTGAEGGEAWFDIKDNGHGLGEATLADLQEPFVTTRESGRGMGLGLAISAGIVQDHGGTMTARNRDAGGAVFRVAFPVRQAEEDQP